MKINLRYLVLVASTLPWVCHSAESDSGFGAVPTSIASDRIAKSSDPVNTLVARVKASLRTLNAGTFDMGDWGNEHGLPYDMASDSRPLHKVTLDSFSMMAYKVTYDDFDIFTDAIGVERIDIDRYAAKYRAPNRPAGVSWYGAEAYCKWLGKTTGLAFALPTEAQWEYAARSGGQRFLYATDNGKIDYGRNYPAEWKDGPKPPIPNVGSYPANPAGLHGMSEETFEWVADWYDENYYKISPNKNPTGPATGTKKVHRGKLGGSAEAFALVFARGKELPQELTHDFSFETKKTTASPLPGYSGYPSSNFRCAVNPAVH